MKKTKPQSNETRVVIFMDGFTNIWTDGFNFLVVCLAR